LRLTPKPASGQRVLSWRIDGPGKRSEWTDGHGNAVTTFSVARPHERVEIVVEGAYEFSGADQWLRYAETPTLPAPFWLRNEGLAQHDASFDPIVADLAPRAADHAHRVGVLHEVMARVEERIAYKTGVSTVETTAAEALERGAGVAQDHAHAFHRLLPPPRHSRALCQRLTCATTIPTCWPAAPAIPGPSLDPELEWVGFDPANRISRAATICAWPSASTIAMLPL